MRPILLLILATLALPAWAADTGNAASNLHYFTPPPGDLSVDFLKKIFGSAEDGINLGGSKTMLGAAMRVFNQAVLLLAMFFVFFTTIKGTIDSANSGVLLGEKMSSYWVPVRTITGTALLLPLTSGFSLIQYGVLWLALQGVGVADTLWTAAMTQFAQTGSLGTVSIPDARPLAANILRAEVCMAAMNKQYEAEGRKERIEVREIPSPNFDLAHQQKADPTGIGLVDSYYETAVQVADSFYITVNYRWQSTVMSEGSPAACGSLEWQESEEDKRTKSMTHAPRSGIMAAHREAVKKMIEELRPVAQQLVIPKRPEPGAVDLAAKHYEDAISAAAKAAVEASPDIARQSFQKFAQEGGWVLAGSFFNQLIKVNDSIQAAANMSPVSKMSRIENLEVSEALIMYQDFMGFTDEYLKDRSKAPKKSYEAELENSSSIRSADEIWRILSIPAMSALQGITARIAGANTSPLTQLRAIGNDIISAGIVIKGSYFIAAGFSGGWASKLIVGSVFNVTEALRTLSSTVEWISSSLWAIGAVLAFYLPAVPVIWWVTGVIRWLAGVAEACISAPLMAAMMTSSSSNGDDVTGRSGPGWMLILAMVIQPALLVLGFIIAAAMTYPAGALVNSVFVSLVSGASAGSMVGVVSLVAWTALYVVMMVLAMHTCFGLIHAVPDNVMRYVGGQAGGPSINQPTDKSIGGLETGAGAAGGAAARPKAPGGNDPKPGGKAGGESRGGNGFTNADHMPGN